VPLEVPLEWPFELPFWPSVLGVGHILVGVVQSEFAVSWFSECGEKKKKKKKVEDESNLSIDLRPRRGGFPTQGDSRRPLAENVGQVFPSKAV
jgi:hypothetical protein